jgi:hypothetical protein
MALSFSDATTGWSFECPAGSGGEPPAGGLVVKNVRHQSNNFARDMRLVGLRLTVAEVDPSGAVASKSNVFVQLDSASFEFGAIQELKTTAVGAPPGAAGAGATFLDRLKRAADTLVLLESYFKDPSGVYSGYGVRVDYTAKPSLLAAWSNCEVSALTLSQIFLFSGYGLSPPHEPGGVLKAARCHPLTSYVMKENPAVDRTRRYQRIESIRFDYRLNLTIDAKPAEPGGPLPYPGANNAGLFRDNDSVSLTGGFAGTVFHLSRPLGYSKGAFAAVEKPLVLEVVAPGVEKGLSSYKEGGTEYTCWDNLHWWGFRGKGAAMISTPGAFHAAHMHWRWGSAGSALRKSIPEIDTTGRPKELPKDLPGSAGGSLLVDPGIWIQSIRVAVVHNDPSLNPNEVGVTLDKLSKEDWKSLFTGLRSEPLEIAEGTDIVCWYSVEVPRELSTPSKTMKNKLEGTVFLHGLFFAHEAEITGFGIGDTGPQHWSRSESTIKSGKQWFRDAS